MVVVDWLTLRMKWGRSTHPSAMMSRPVMGNSERMGSWTETIPFIWMKRRERCKLFWVLRLIPTTDGLSHCNVETESRLLSTAIIFIKNSVKEFRLFKNSLERKIGSNKTCWFCNSQKALLFSFTLWAPWIALIFVKEI